MPPEQAATRYMPTSPLSPKLRGSARPLSPQPGRPRSSQNRQTARTTHMNLPRYHPTKFQQNDSTFLTSSTGQSPVISLQRMPQSIQLESPRLMREKQRELIDRARMSSRIAASPLGVKPDAPRLDPLGSPKGPVTPLALEEAADYFQVSGVGRISPASSPSVRGFRSDVFVAKDDLSSKKLRKPELYP